MKKLLIAFLAAMLMLSLTGCFEDEAASVGIIGGADGPTSIFVTK